MSFSNKKNKKTKKKSVLGVILQKPHFFTLLKKEKSKFKY